MALNVSSLRFNGTTRYAKLSTNASIRNFENFTWMAWVKVGPDSTRAVQRAYVERQGTGAGIRFACTPIQGKLRFELSIKDNVTDTNYDFRYDWDDRWHHVAFVARVSGTNPSYTIYLDAQEVAEGTLVRPSGQEIISNTAPLGSIYLGNYSLHTSGGESFPSDRYWQGGIDEILIFNAAKNQDDILAYFTSDDIWDMGDTEMFSYWRFDENTGTTTTDSDNGGWSGTLYASGVASSTLWQLDRPFLGNGTTDSTAPTTPTLPGTPTFNITNDGFTADWNLTTDNVFVQYYELQVATVSDFSSYVSHILEDQDTAVISSKVLTGLLPGTNYYWRVRAFDAALNASGYTATQSLTTLGTGDVVAPLAPTNVTITSILHSGFTVNWTASASSDEAGYKLDVAYDPTFTNYLSGYRNKDVGNVVTTVVSGTAPITTYYVRVRAYDAAGNESASTATSIVQTPTQPDVVPPSVVVLENPSSLSSRAFTANWEEGIDNVGIDYYLLDVATDALFASPVVNALGTWSSVNIGNVTAYRIEDLSPETNYYYRVRAVDFAGNISSNQAEPMIAVTTEPTIEEGGFLTTRVEPQGDSWTNSASTAQNNGTATALEVLGNGSTNTRAAFIQFNLSTVVGAIQSATLNVYVTEASAGTFRVAVDNVTFDEATITWANQPTVSGLDLTFSPASLNQWVSVDISSLLLDGATTYTVKLFTTSADGASFSSKEGLYPPFIELEHDPATATNIIDLSIDDDADGTLVNYFTNPSGEDASTTKWVATGSTPAVITNIDTDSYHGTRCFNVVASGAAADQGAVYTPTEIVADDGQWWTTKVALKSVSGSTSVRIRLVEYTSGGVFVAETSQTVTISTTEWRVFSISRLLTGVTTARVSLWLAAPNSTAATFKFDATILSRSRHEVPYFDGDTAGAVWSGTVKASTSTLASAQFEAESTYIGDADGDNSVQPYIKRTDDAQWIYMPGMLTSVTHNRTTKRVETVYGHAYGRYNEIRNPSFEIDTAGWSLYNPNSNASMVRTTDISYYGLASLALTVGTGSGSAVLSNEVPAVSGEIWNANAKLWIPVGMTVRLAIRAITSAGAFLAESSATPLTFELPGNDAWETLWQYYTLPATTARVNIALSVTSAVAGTIYIDGAFLNKANLLHVNPYRDGTFDDAIWEGAEHNSATGLRLLPAVSYDILHEYTDPDGLFENTGTTQASIALSHTTAHIADNATTAGVLELTPSLNGISVVLPYTGDDNESMTAIVSYHRTDLSDWIDVSTMHHRDHKHLHAEIENLAPGTSYTVRVVLTDADGVYNAPSNTVLGVTTTLTNQIVSAGASRIMFGGFVLFDGSNETMKYGVVSHNAYSLPDRRVQVDDLPLVDGAIELTNLWGRREIRMQGFVWGENPADLEANLISLKRALTPRLQRLVIDTLGTSGRYYNATCESFVVEQTGAINTTHLIWNATFVCADPFAYDPTPQQLPETTVANGGTFIVTNYGDMKVDVAIHIHTTHPYPVTVTVVNNTTGERITPQATITNGDRLHIDSTIYSIRKNGLSVNYAGGFIHLNPGSNQFSFIVSSTSGTPSIIVDMHWQTRHF